MDFVFSAARKHFLHFESFMSNAFSRFVFFSLSLYCCCVLVYQWQLPSCRSSNNTFYFPFKFDSGCMLVLLFAIFFLLLFLRSFWCDVVVVAASRQSRANLQLRLLSSCGVSLCTNNAVSSCSILVSRKKRRRQKSEPVSTQQNAATEIISKLLSIRSFSFFISYVWKHVYNLKIKRWLRFVKLLLVVFCFCFSRMSKHYLSNMKSATLPPNILNQKKKERKREKHEFHVFVWCYKCLASALNSFSIILCVNFQSEIASAMEIFQSRLKKRAPNALHGIAAVKWIRTEFFRTHFEFAPDFWCIQIEID